MTINCVSVGSLLIMIFFAIFNLLYSSKKSKIHCLVNFACSFAHDYAWSRIKSNMRFPLEDITEDI